MRIRKGAQLGVTEFVINTSFYAIDEHGATVFYALPPGISVVGDFAHDRVDPAIAHSPRLQQIQAGTDNVGLKTFDRGALYIRGTSVPPGRPDKAPQLASVPADIAIIDEMDRVPPAALPLIEDRLGDSHLKVNIGLSTPTFPGVGIDAEYAETDQREPQIQCQDCGRWHWLVWDLVQNRDGQIAVWCPSCGAAIDRDSAWDHNRMRFRPRNPGMEVIGYWLPKLVSPRASLAGMWDRSLSHNAEQVLAFHNNDLGVGYEPEGARLTRDLLRGCIDEYTFPDRATWCAMGVDVGYGLNVWIMQADGERNRAVYIGEVLHWEELDRLMIRYGVRVCVVDDGPELTADLAFVRRHRGKAFLATYVQDIPGSEWTRWDPSRQRVQIDRTAGLDRSHGNIEAQVDSLPHDFEMIPDFVEQMTVNLKTKGVRPDGTVQYVFPRTGKPDHYDHAKVYCEAAMERLRRMSRPKTDAGSGGPVPVTGDRQYRGRA